MAEVDRPVFAGQRVGGDSPSPEAPGWEVGWVECGQCGRISAEIARWAIVQAFPCKCGATNDFMTDDRRIALNLPNPRDGSR